MSGLQEGSARPSSTVQRLLTESTSRYEYAPRSTTPARTAFNAAPKFGPVDSPSIVHARRQRVVRRLHRSAGVFACSLSTSSFTDGAQRAQSCRVAS